jgi:hypothetical protein
MSFSLIKGKLAAGYPARLPASEEAADTRARPHGGHAGDRRGAIPQHREVAAALAAGERFPAPSAAKLVARRSSIGGVGNLALDLIRGTLAPGPRVAVHRAGTRPHPAQAHRAIGPARPSDHPTVCPFHMTADRRKRHLKILALHSTRVVRTQEDTAEHERCGPEVVR